MLFKADILERIAQGEVTLAFRRWARPSVKVDGRLRTAAGELAIDELREISPEEIGQAEAKRAGYPDAGALRAELLKRDKGRFYRIAFHLAGPDRRLALREEGDLGEAQLEDIVQRLRKFDARAEKAWAIPVLRLIGEGEGRPAAALAQELGFEKLALKQRIRKLKELGLTISLQTGYRLSKRGRSVLDHLDRQ